MLIKEKKRFHLESIPFAGSFCLIGGAVGGMHRPAVDIVQPRRDADRRLWDQALVHLWGKWGGVGRSLCM